MPAAGATVDTVTDGVVPPAGREDSGASSGVPSMPRGARLAADEGTRLQPPADAEGRSALAEEQGWTRTDPGAFPLLAWAGGSLRYWMSETPWEPFCLSFVVLA